MEVASEALPFMGFRISEGGEVDLVGRLEEAWRGGPGFEPGHAKEDVSRSDASEAEVPDLACFGDDVVGEVVGPAGVVGTGVPEAREDVKLT